MHAIMVSYYITSFKFDCHSFILLTFSYSCFCSVGLLSFGLNHFDIHIMTILFHSLNKVSAFSNLLIHLTLNPVTGSKTSIWLGQLILSSNFFYHIICILFFGVGQVITNSRERDLGITDLLEFT